MTMHNPPYPGEFIREVYLEPFGLSVRQLVKSIRVFAVHALTCVARGQRNQS